MNSIKERLARDPKGWTFQFAPRAGLDGSCNQMFRNNNGALQPLFPGLGIWACQQVVVGDFFKNCPEGFLGVVGSKALYLTQTTTSIETEHETNALPSQPTSISPQTVVGETSALGKTPRVRQDLSSQATELNTLMQKSTEATETPVLTPAPTKYTESRPATVEQRLPTSSERIYVMSNEGEQI